MRLSIAAVSVVLVMGMLNCVANAQEPVRVYPVSSVPTYDMVPGQYPVVIHNHYGTTGMGYSPNPPVRSTPVGDWARKCYACCWSHHDNLDCGSLKSELTFIFGSCRAFYGERCLPKPLTVDRHGWWDRTGRY